MTRILLDLDGTLVDSDPYCLAKGTEALQQMQLEYTPADVASSLACNLYLAKLPAETRTEFWKVFDKLDTRWTSIDSIITLFPDTIEFLKQVPTRPFVITNTPSQKAWNEVRHFGIEKYLAGMVCAEKGNGKPKPDIALTALKQMTGNGPIYVIGDTETDTELVPKLRPHVTTPVTSILVQKQQGIAIQCDYRTANLIDALKHIQ